MKRQEKRFSLFTGFEVDSVERIKKIEAPKDLICLAHPTEISYYSNKLNGGGDGKFATYVHRFSASTQLYTDPAGRFIVIAGPNLRVTQRGIVG